MLVALRIESFAIIESLEIRFGSGLNVLTGETGAGKSILVDALSLLLGGRADPGMIRRGAEEAVVEGIFAGEGLAAKARALGLPADGNEVLVRRTVARGGRGRVHLNGALATVSLLAELLRGEVDLSGQHEHLSLLRRESHGGLLDRFGGSEGLMERFSASYGEWARLQGERERLQREEAERERRKGYLAFLLEEWEEVDPREGEEELLAAERRVLGESEKIREALIFAEGAMESEERSAADRLAASLRRLTEASGWDPRLLPVARQVETALVEVREAARSLIRHADSLASDPERLAQVDERLEALRRIARKHGGDLGSALRAREEMALELRELELSSTRSAALEEEIARAAAAAVAIAGELSSRRREAAVRLIAGVLPHLERLRLEGARIEVRFSEPEGALRGEGAAVGPRGAEEVEFLLCANVGEEAKPLSKVASGGELSRVLLALKSVLASVDPVSCYVFDEVDAGIGGETALFVGRMLQDAARERQVLCVTHLPQVAAFADVHLHVCKRVESGRTFSTVEPLEGEGERQRNLARMLAGSEDPSALAAAGDLLLRSRGGRPPKGRRAHRRGRGGDEVRIPS